MNNTQIILNWNAAPCSPLMLLKNVCEKWLTLGIWITLYVSSGPLQWQLWEEKCHFKQKGKSVWKRTKVPSPPASDPGSMRDQEMKASKVFCKAKPLPTLFSLPSHVEGATKNLSPDDYKKKITLKLLNPCLLCTGQFHWVNELLASPDNSFHPPFFIFLFMTQFSRYTGCRHAEETSSGLTEWWLRGPLRVSTAALSIQHSESEWRLWQRFAIRITDKL